MKRNVGPSYPGPGSGVDRTQIGGSRVAFVSLVMAGAPSPRS
jgi:hypothetical protein